MKDPNDTNTIEIDYTPTPPTYTAHLTLDDGTTIVWARLTKREASTLYKLNLKAFSAAHSTSDMRRTGWGEL